MSKVLEEFYRTLDIEFGHVSDIRNNFHAIRQNKYLTEQMKFANIKNDLELAINHLSKLPQVVEQFYNEYVDEQATKKV